eukprot:1137388-Pelagomonas_calceolata.AAC.1
MRTATLQILISSVSVFLLGSLPPRLASVHECRTAALNWRGALVGPSFFTWIFCWLARTSHRPISRTVWLKVPPCKSKSKSKSNWRGTAGFLQVLGEVCHVKSWLLLSQTLVCEASPS